MVDPVLGPLNNYSRGGPAAVGPYNNPSKKIDNDMKLPDCLEAPNRGAESDQGSKGDQKSA
eukprot:CAMPEP_0185595206 /NCGR_PEP_ID=MMETSP0434-20130131/77589_1 /TAXON_ID=626734 ORGANISM="Favella taraikaensis, Strain Fe Narragansett Bay" /NCGR_SAMPLE_ID=MMETSP0434 /ASSEMBLY_ACC=CAM_ASM_000379 /LENGTH=60 /DNA_ID=CAMNT_0028223047 /DNA_START=139 /DNA_END=321 /DNA_ORIENTATION=-